MKPKAKKTLLTMMPFSKTFLVGALLFISSAGFAQNQVIKLQQRKATLIQHQYNVKYHATIKMIRNCA